MTPPDLEAALRSSLYPATRALHEAALGMAGDLTCIRETLTRPSVIYRPTLTKDGDQWCALYGPDIHSGFCAWGDTPAEAMPHETGSRDPKVVHQSEDRRGVVGAVGGAGAGIRPAESREVTHDEAMACGEIPDNALPEAGGGGEPMEEDDRYSLPAGAGGEIVHALPTDIHELASHAW